MGVTNERIVERMVQNGWHRRTAERMVEKGRPGSWQEPLAVAMTRFQLELGDFARMIVRALPIIGKRL
jgi:hypothetical protein